MEGCSVTQEHLESASVKAVRKDAVQSTLKERESQYGDYTVQAEWAQDAKLSCRQTPNWCALSGAQRESIDMIVTKLSRILHGDYNHQDSWLDLAGYSHLGAGWKPVPKISP